MDVLYWFSIPFVNAFNFSETIIIPMLVAMAGLGLHGLMNRTAKLRLTLLDGLVGAFLLSAIMSTLLNVSGLGAKNLNHLAALFTSYGVLYYAALKLSSRLSVERILAVLWAGYVVCTVFGLVEFALVNLTSFDLDALVYRPSVPDYKPAFLDILLIRSRSLFEESGYYANYLAILIPLMVHYLWRIKQSRAARVAFIVLTATGAFAAFSVSMFIFLPLALVAPTVLRVLFERRVSRSMLLLLAIVVVLALLVVSSDTLMEILFYRKFEGNSFDDRSNKFDETLKAMNDSDWLHALFGFGPGSYFNLGVLPATSVYLNFWRDYGFVGLLAYVASALHFLRISFADKSPLGQAIFVAALVVQLFFIAIPTYYAPVTYVPMLLYELHRRRATAGRPNAVASSGPARAAGIPA